MWPSEDRNWTSFLSREAWGRRGRARACSSGSTCATRRAYPCRSSGDKIRRHELTTGFLDIAGPARIYYREAGAGIPLVFLHGGWGYEVYPFDQAIAALSGRFRILIPDRTGYGRSTPIMKLPADFHRRAAIETAHFLDALHIERTVLWGHSDGAVIAALLALDAPRRVSAAIFEAFHYTRAKNGSTGFFRAMISEPDTVGGRASVALGRDHGEEWRKVLERNAT